MNAGVKYLDRDLSWLSFNERVLQEAANPEVPLLERFKFLSIYSSNLDEFYRVRMPAIKALDRIKKEKGPDTILNQVTVTIQQQLNFFGSVLNSQLVPALGKSGYIFLNNGIIPDFIENELRQYFFTHVAGLLQPVLLTQKTGFFPENNVLYLAVVVTSVNVPEQFYLVNIPCDVLPRFYAVTVDTSTYIVFLEDIVSCNLSFVFRNAVAKGYNIKITRDANLDLGNDYDEDLAEKIEKQLKKRDMGLATRFLYQPGIPIPVLQFIIQKFNLVNAAVVEGGMHHNLKDLADLPVGNSELKYAAWKPLTPAFVTDGASTLFGQIVLSDRLIHTPYHSYDTVIRFFNEAAIDPDVEEIYTTMYRVAGNSRIAHALISAAKSGKKVTVLVELKARFDEANNIRWAKRMKPAGVKIIYSDNKLKVHAKVALVKRKHKQFPALGLFATGNFNETTARFYTDHILLTANQEMLAELTDLFTFLSKKKRPSKEDAITLKHLLVSQFNLLDEFQRLIDREIENAGIGLPAEIIIKLNNLEEELLIDKLYQASMAGVSVKLIVRGICRLVPGIKGLSENITVRRIVDRYLEHGRVFIFANGGSTQMLMGSADWMNRNIYHRIEVCFPIYNKTLIAEMLQIISLQLSDNVSAVDIKGNYSQVRVKNSGKKIRSQWEIFNYFNK
jgi:polyphosphate kinase